ncbi:MAG: glycosyltransferase family 39 protein [Chitinophagaceae bacterium]|nr:glycosyltransferase family 39 protein [Chitinophagaceae bacterium]
MNRQTRLIIFSFCTVKLILHLIADSHSGFQGDELLHIETGNHLAWGYMEFPPLIGLFAFIQNLFGSDAVYIHHLFPHICSILILIFVAKTTLELGGGNKAVFLVLLGIIIAPGFGRSQQLFQPVVFSQLFWVLSFYYLVRFVKLPDTKSLWLLTLFCLLGLMVKYDAVFFLFGLLSLSFFKQTRDALIRNKCWINIGVFALAILPNVIWQVTHDYPVLQMFSRLYETQLNDTNRLETIRNLLISINPVVSLLLVIPGILYLSTAKNKGILYPLGVAMVLSFLFLLYKNGKAYYFFPLVLTIIPLGAVYLEQKVLSKRKWIIYPVAALMILGAVMIPFGMPVYSLDRYLSKVYPFEKKKTADSKYAVKFEEYYSNELWTNTMQQLQAVYDSLPAEVKSSCLLWGKHYRQAGAVSLFGKKYGLPAAFSYHGSFYSWAPSGQMPQTVVALSNKVNGFFEQYFTDVKKVRAIYNSYSYKDEESYQYIYVCQNPKQDFDQMKELFKHRIFE